MSNPKQIPANYPHALIQEPVAVPFDVSGAFGVGGVHWQMRVPQQLTLARMLRQSDLETIHPEDKDPQMDPVGMYTNWCRTVHIYRRSFAHHVIVLQIVRAGDLALSTEEIFQCEYTLDVSALRQDGGGVVTHAMRTADEKLTSQGCCPLGQCEHEFIIQALTKVMHT